MSKQQEQFNRKERRDVSSDHVFEPTVKKREQKPNKLACQWNDHRMIESLTLPKCIRMVLAG